MKRLDNVTIEPTASIGEALARIDRAGTGALVLCSPAGKLIGFLTDGDIRRAILRGIPMDKPCGTIANLQPITADQSVSAGEALYLMIVQNINHLPLIDSEGELKDLLLRKDLVAEENLGRSVLKRLDSVVVPSGISVAEAVFRLDQAGTGGLALCAPGGKLLGVLTDGDIRRAILRGVSLEASCDKIASQSPITAGEGISASEALRLMAQHDINHLPVVDDQGNLVEFLLRRDLIQESPSNLSAVIMAGGFGTRMLPLTERVPKPMLPLGDRPLLERTLEQLRRSGIRDVSLTTHYLPEAIVRHFGDGEAFGVRINYTNEDEPLGTAGGLRLVKRPDGPFVVINGDVLTGVSFEDMLRYHRRHDAEITVGVRKHEVKVPFGVVECEDARITQLHEKPTLTVFINAGIYLLEPSAYDLIPDGGHFDMTDLIKRMLDEGRRVIGFPIVEYWQDMGRPEDYQQAQADLRDALI